jgi:hypothetical protein
VSDKRDRIVALLRAAWPELPESTAKVYARNFTQLSFNEADIQEGITQSPTRMGRASAKEIIALIRVIRDDRLRATALPPPRTLLPEGDRLERCKLACFVLFASYKLREIESERDFRDGFKRLMQRERFKLEGLVNLYEGRLREANVQARLSDFYPQAATAKEQREKEDQQEVAS